MASNSMSTDERNLLIYKTKVSLAANRFDYMVDSMKKIASSVNMTDMERNLFYCAYLKEFLSRRSSLLAIDAYLLDAKDDVARTEVLGNLKKTIYAEITKMCNELHFFANERLSSTEERSTEDTIFFMTMKADFYSFTMNYNPSEQLKIKVNEWYEKPTEAAKDLSWNPLKLSLYFNYAYWLDTYNQQSKEATNHIMGNYDKT